jgi:hypothetical protein
LILAKWFQSGIGWIPVIRVGGSVEDVSEF